MTTDLKIFGARTGYGVSPERLRMVAGWIRPISLAAISAGLVGWLVLFFMFQQGQAGRVEALAMIIALISLLGVMLPYGADFLAQEARKTEDELGGHLKVQLALREQLTGRWAYFQNISLRNSGLIDGVLVGTDGVFALSVETAQGTYRASEMEWQARNAENQWVQLLPNPSEKIEAQAAQLADYFAASDCEGVAVLPRIAWATDALLMADEPTVPIWQLAVDDAIRDDLAQLVSAELDRDSLQKISALLRAVSAESSQ